MRKHTEDLERVNLLFGPYTAPALSKGDQVFCLYRDCNVVITSWTDARISWPRCRAIESRGGSGLLVDARLLRATKHESAASLYYWFGVGVNAVWSWRKAFGITKFGTEGSKRLHEQACEAGADMIRGVPLPPEAIEERRQRAIELNLAQHLTTGHHGPRWTQKQLRMLGKLPDAEVAAKIGRAVNAVRIMRERLGISNPVGNRWIDAELALLGTMHDADLGKKMGRPTHAATRKRIELGIPNRFDRRKGRNRAGRILAYDTGSTPASRGL